MIFKGPWKCQVFSNVIKSFHFKLNTTLQSCVPYRRVYIFIIKPSSRLELVEQLLNVAIDFMSFTLK